MRIAVDALSATNLSARRVLLGHLNAIATAHRDRHSFIVLYHEVNSDLVRDISPNVVWVKCDAMTSQWAGRLVWQIFGLPSLLREYSIDVVINPTGSLVPGIHLPQIVLAQNPWCFVPAFHLGLLSSLRAYLQRRAYHRAQLKSHFLFCNSYYLANLYVENAKGCKRSESILYNGIDESVFRAAQPIASLAERQQDIITVSVMTPHKNIEALLEAHALLLAGGIKARLHLVGPWASHQYKLQIEQRIVKLGLQAWVLIHGYVRDVDLHVFYRRARIFVLLSYCESFGLPAVEAQAFGTPSIVADVSAPPEIAGPGGLVVPPDAPQTAAMAIEQLLCDDRAWQSASSRALKNAERFRWSIASKPLVDCLAHDKIYD